MPNAKVQIKELRILNYKSFRDSGWLNLGENFTVVVGQNNSGKTALIQSLRLHEAPNHPHRGPAVREQPGQNPNSRFQLRLRASGAFLKASILRDGFQAYVAMPSPDEGTNFLKEMFSRAFVDFEVEFGADHGNVRTLRKPSHQLCDPNSVSFLTQANDDRSDVVLYTSHSGGENLFEVFRHSIGDFRYVFDPERLRIGMCDIQNTEILEPGAQNLPAVLARLNKNPARWAAYNAHVRQVFPSIRGVSVSTLGSQLAIFVWSNDPEKAADDEAFLLQESGTGVGQVLAILYVAMTATGSVIAIDEPNSFLHPGAAKKLMMILKSYRQNQYIISTHSPELLSVIDPEVLLHVSWEDGESRVEQLERRSMETMRRILEDVGCELGDVFIAEKIVWVEGETEAKCFPLIVDDNDVSTISVLFQPLSATGDLERKKADTALVLRIYDAVSKGGALLSRSTAFNLDREGRNADDIAKLEERSQGRIHFLPTATYENYLLDPNAIAAVLAAEYREYDAGEAPPGVEEVETWIDRHAAEFLPARQPVLDRTDPEWQRQVNGAQLLVTLFPALTGSLFVYRKPHHSVALTKWLLAHRPENLAELRAYVIALIA